jgi:hypothetical protein
MKGVDAVSWHSAGAVIASEAKQSSRARSAPNKKSGTRGEFRVSSARLPARSWIASLRSQ